jgi:hypothetical protein
MTAETESNEPNEWGFAGDPSTPEPQPTSRSEDDDAEGIAVPSGDLTAPIMEALEGAGPRRDDDEDTPS